MSGAIRTGHALADRFGNTAMGLRDLYIALIYLAFLVIGASAPFVFVLGYVWVDNSYPQEISDYLMPIPVALILGIAAIGGYLLTDRKYPPRVTGHMVLTLVFAAWITMTLAWAEVPNPAWYKWNYAFKTVAFSIVLTLMIRSRVQIEAFLQVLLFSMALHVLPLGIKNLLSGSGYGRNLGVLKGNSLLLESSTLATAAIMLIPIILYLRAHSVIVPKSRLRDLGYLAMAGAAVMCALGTFARTALVGFAVLGVSLWLQSRRKVLFSCIAVVLVIGFGAMTSSSWNERIATTVDYNQEDSALGRILVWQWTLEYVKDHPLGGGFNSYMIDRIQFPSINGDPPAIVYGKAFHNTLIEVLGEHGFPGLLIFVTLVVLSLLYLYGVARRTRGQPYLLWLHDLANTLITSLLVIMACGNFIQIGFQAMTWYLLALAVCVREYYHHVQKLERATTPVFVAGQGPRKGALTLPGLAR